MTPAPDARSLPMTVEQAIHLGIGQRRGRLVHQQDSGVGADRLGDLDELLLRQAQRLDATPTIDRRAKPIEKRSALLRHAVASSRATTDGRLRRASAMFSATDKSGNSAGCW